MRILFLLAIITTSFSFTSCRAKNELATFCEVAERINQDTSTTNQDKMVTWAQTVHPTISSIRGRRFFYMFATQMDSPTYAQFKEYAAEVGEEDWSCEALKDLLESEL